MIERSQYKIEERKKSKEKMHRAAKDGNMVKILTLLNYGKNINATDERRNTPLHYALYCRKLETVKLLVRIGADISIGNIDGETPLHLAVDTLNTNFVKVILDRGPNLNARDKDGNTPLHTLVGNHYYNNDTMVDITIILEMLLKAGADPTITNNEGKTPLRIYDILTSNTKVHRSILIVQFLEQYAAMLEIKEPDMTDDD